MTSPSDKELISRSIRDIADGRGVPGQPPTPQQRQRAQELLPELSRQPQQRPGVWSLAQSTAEEYFRSAGRLRPDESLTDPLAIQVKQTNGATQPVSLPRMGRASQLRARVTGGLILAGRPLRDDELLYDLWLRDGLGSTAGVSAAAGGGPPPPPPHVQETVRNVGG